MTSNYNLITKVSDLEKYVSNFNSKFIGFDTETTGLSPYDGKLRLIQISNGESEVMIDCFAFDNYEQIGQLLNPILEDEKVVKIGHNLKFDYQFILHYLNGRLKGIFDTYLGAILVNFNGDGGAVKGRHSLERVGKLYLGVTLSKEEQKSDWSGVLTKSQLTYAANDVRHMLPLREVLLDKLKTTLQLRAAKLEFDTVASVAEMEYRGFPINLEKFDAFLQANEIERANKAAKLREWFKTDGHTLSSYDNLVSVNLFGEEVEILTESDVNIKSQKQLINKFSKLGIDVEDTDKKTLAIARSKYPELGLLLDYRESEKLSSTYGKSFIKNVHPITGRIHSSFFQCGAETLRFSSSSPNLQNLPNESAFRDVFSLIDEDRKFCILDYSGFELRSLANYSGDEVMLKGFEDGVDMHTLSASLIFGIPYDQVTKALRYIAKQINFSIAYGIGASGLVRRFSADGLNKTMEEGQELIDKWYSSYQGCHAWLKDRERAIVRDKGHIRGIGGHLMQYHFDPKDYVSLGMAQRASKNWPVQNSNAVATKRSMKLVHDSLMANYSDAYICNVIHDELVIEHNAKDSKEIEELASQCMIAGAKEYLTKVKVEVSSAIGTSWADKQ